MNERERFYAARRRGVIYRDPDHDVVICPGVRGRSCGVHIPARRNRILCQYCTRTVELLVGATSDFA